MALGDAIYVKCNKALSGIGDAGAVVPVTETLKIEALIADQSLTVVAGPATAVQPPLLDYQVQDARILQYARERTDKRTQRPLSVEGVVTRTVTLDGTLTKALNLPIGSLAANQFRVATQAELDAHPVKFSCGKAYPVLFRSGSGTTAAFVPSMNPNGINSAGTGNSAPWPYDITVRTNAPKVQVGLYRVLGATVQGDQVFVDGAAVQTDPAVGVGAVDYVTVVFPEAGEHTVTVRTSAFYISTNVAPIYDVWAPDGAAIPAPSMFTLGDSYSAPIIWADNGTSAGLVEEGYAAQMQDALGIVDHYIDGVGGTGFLHRTPTGFQAPNNNYIDRLPNVLQVAADITWVPNGATNDVANRVTDGKTVQQIANEVEKFFRTVRSRRPDSLLVYGAGICPSAITAINANQAAENMQIVALLRVQLADVGVYYFDNTGWLTGAGSVNAPAGDGGNQDWAVGTDKAHGTRRGYKYLRLRARGKLRKAFLDWSGSRLLVNQVI